MHGTYTDHSLFNRSREASTFPSIWKCGQVTALFKGGDRTDCNNYRPITVIPTFSKILERAVHQQLYEFLSANELLTPNQFGFRPKLSTVTTFAHFTASLEQFSFEAFDTVDHVILVEKLKSTGASSQASS